LRKSSGAIRKIQVQIERIHVRPERPRRRPAEDRLHHRRLDFHVPALVELAADCRNHPAAQPERRLRRLVHDQVHIPLPVALLDVLQPVPFLRQRPQRLREQLQPVRLDRQLPLLRDEDRSLHPDNVADVQMLLEQIEPRRLRRILLDVGLEAPRVVLERQKPRLPHDPVQQHAPRHPHRLGRGDQRLLIAPDLRRRMRRVVTLHVQFDPRLAHARRLLATRRDDAALLRGFGLLALGGFRPVRGGLGRGGIAHIPVIFLILGDRSRPGWTPDNPARRA
jgi:hypothetical protein